MENKNNVNETLRTLANTLENGENSNEMVLLKALQLNLSIEDNQFTLTTPKGKTTPHVFYDVKNDSKVIFKTDDYQFDVQKDSQNHLYIKKISTNDGLKIYQTTDDNGKRQLIVTQDETSKTTKMIIDDDNFSITNNNDMDKKPTYICATKDAKQNIKITGNTENNYQFLIDEVLKIEDKYPTITGRLNSVFPVINQSIEYCQGMRQALQDTNIIDLKQNRKL